MPPLDPIVRNQLLDVYQSSNADNLMDNLDAYESTHPLDQKTKSNVDQVARCWNRGGEVEECLDAEEEAYSNVHWDYFSDDTEWQKLQGMLQADATDTLVTQFAETKDDEREKQAILDVRSDFQKCVTRRGPPTGLGQCRDELEMRRQLYDEATLVSSPPPPIPHRPEPPPPVLPHDPLPARSIERTKRREERERDKPARQEARRQAWERIKNLFHSSSSPAHVVNFEFQQSSFNEYPNYDDIARSKSFTPVRGQEYHFWLGHTASWFKDGPAFILYPFLGEGVYYSRFDPAILATDVSYPEIDQAAGFGPTLVGERGASLDSWGVMVPLGFEGDLRPLALFNKKYPLAIYARLTGALRLGQIPPGKNTFLESGGLEDKKFVAEGITSLDLGLKVPIPLSRKASIVLDGGWEPFRGAVSTNKISYFSYEPRLEDFYASVEIQWRK